MFPRHAKGPGLVDYLYRAMFAGDPASPQSLQNAPSRISSPAVASSTLLLCRKMMWHLLLAYWSEVP